MEGDDLRDEIMRMIEDVVERSVAEAVGEAKYAEEWNFRHLRDELCSVIPLTDLDVDQKELDSLTQQAYTERLTEKAKELYEAKEQEVQPDRMREVERMILLRVVDNRWMDHIDIMDQMRQGIGLQAYAQKNPLDEYKFCLLYTSNPAILFERVDRGGRTRGDSQRLPGKP